MRTSACSTAQVDVGGINVSDHNFGWHDLMVRIEGPLVADLAADYGSSWDGPTVARFLDHVRADRHYPAWLFLATTGCRRGEALGLRWSDVEESARGRSRHTISTRGAEARESVTWCLHGAATTGEAAERAKETISRSLSGISVSLSSSSNSGTTSTEAKDVCRLLWALNGDGRTRRAT